MKTVIKKLLCFTVIIAITAAVIPVNVSSYTALRYRDDPQASGDPGLYLEECVDTDALREALIPHLTAFETYIDVSGFNIPVSAQSSLNNFIWKEIPECFNVYGLDAVASAGYITKVYATYQYEDTYAGMLEESIAAADRILDGIAGNNGLDDVQKALLLHDRLCVICEYDYTYSNYNMYDALVSGSAVCEGYTAAYSYLLRRAGIKSYSCASESMNHIWNLVKIDGTYYHTDVTWDDAGWGVDQRGLVGGVKHAHFLLSNEGIAQDHQANDYYTPENDERFDSYFWRDSLAEFVLEDGEIYYFDNTASEIKTYDGQKLTDAKGRWYANDAGSYWTGNFGRLSSGGGKLLYSLPAAIWAYDLESGQSEKIYEPELEGVDAIYGFTYKDGMLIMDINNVPVNDVTRLCRIIVPYETEPPAPPVYGDCNGDGTIDGRDLIRLRKYLDNLDEATGESLYEISPYSDCNGDGMISGADVIRLRKYLAEYNDETGTSSVILGVA